MHLRREKPLSNESHTTSQQGRKRRLHFVYFFTVHRPTRYVYHFQYKTNFHIKMCKNRQNVQIKEAKKKKSLFWDSFKTQEVQSKLVMHLHKNTE